MLVLCVGAVPTAAQAAAEIPYSDWKKRCQAVPANRLLRGRFPAPGQLPLRDFGAVLRLVERVAEINRRGPLAESANWIGTPPQDAQFFDTRRSYFTRAPIPFQPFAQKFIAPPGSEIIFHGDFHGDVRSFIATLEWLNRSGRLEGFRITRPNTYLVFLGDYTDRGAYGVEVIYTLLRLKLANPQRVFMARGNHEDYLLTANYGFLREVQTKYGRAANPFPIWRMFDFLPVVIYAGVGADFVQCNHGGMEPGYDPNALLNSAGRHRFQMLGALRRQTFLDRHPDLVDLGDARTRKLLESKWFDFRPKSPTDPASIGFMWSDYTLFASEPGLSYNPNRLAFVYGKSTTQYILRAASRGRAQLRAVFRAHQHSSAPNPMMNRLVVSGGSFRHWQPTDRLQQADASRAGLARLVETSGSRAIPSGSVWTFNVSPDSVYGTGNAYSFDTIGILKTAESFDAWRLEVVRVPVAVD